MDYYKEIGRVTWSPDYKSEAPTPSPAAQPEGAQQGAGKLAIGIDHEQAFAPTAAPLVQGRPQVVQEAFDGLHKYADHREGFDALDAQAIIAHIYTLETRPSADAARIAELEGACERLNSIVEGIGVIEHGTWRDDKGLRLKDTPEWVSFYVALKSAPTSPHTAELNGLLLDVYSLIECYSIAESGDDEQDAFEREVFERLKKALGK